jgi:uncharacterized membrane protein YphA (DoxX/SURF4 family)
VAGGERRRLAVSAGPGGQRPVRPSPRLALLFLRASLGLLLVIWGVDKLRDTRHGLVVSEHFYGGVVSSPLVMTGLGAAEVLLGLAVIAGLARRVTDPALLVVTGVTLVAVWRSVLDPLGLFLANTQLLFYPSLIIFAAALVVATARRDDPGAPDGPRDAA